MMNKDYRIEVRVTGAEYRAVTRFAKSSSASVSDLVRARVVVPALNHDPKQMTLLREQEGPPRAS